MSANPLCRQSHCRHYSISRKHASVCASLLFLALVVLSAIYYRKSSILPISASNRTLQKAIKLSSENVTTEQHHSLDHFVTASSPADYGDLCTRDNIFSSKASLGILIPGLLFLFVGLSVVTSSLRGYVRHLQLAYKFLGIGAAQATLSVAVNSAPKLFTNLLGVFMTKDEIGTGTIIGCVVFNILAFIGIIAVSAATPIEFDCRPLLRDSPFLVAGIILLLLFILRVSKGEIVWWEGLILLLLYVMYVLFVVFLNVPIMKWARPLSPSTVNISQDSGFVSAIVIETENPETSASTLSQPSSSSTNIQLECEEDRWFLGIIRKPDSILGWIFFPVIVFWKLLFHYTVEILYSGTRWGWCILLSIVWIGGISYPMVEAARMIGCLLGIPAAVMGMTVLAAGISFQEAMIFSRCARFGLGGNFFHRGLARNVFDILFGLGLPWFLGHFFQKEPIAITVSPITSVVIPIMFLLATTVMLLIALATLKWQTRAWLGYILLGLYAVFVGYAVLLVYVIGK